MTLRAIIFGAALLVAGNGYSAEVSDQAEKINLSRGFAVAMAISKNIDLRVEVLNTSMTETDMARSRGIYDPFFSASATGGVSAVPGDPFFRTKSTTTTLGLSQYLPTGGNIGISAQTGYTTADFDSGFESTTDWQSAAGITFSHPLLKNAGKETTELNIKLAASAHEDALERYRASTIDTVYSVITTYNRLYVLRQIRDARVAALSSAQGLLETIKKKLKPGPLQKVEIANTEYAIALRRKDVVDSERNVRDLEANLRYLIGMEAKTQIIPVDPPSRQEPEETQEQAVKAALESRPDLKQLKLALKSTELQERVSKHQSLPDLSVSASGGISGTGDNIGNSLRRVGDHPSTFWSGGVHFSIPLGNTSAINDYRRSKIRVQQARNQLEALSWRIRNDVEADLRALISARLQLQTSDKARQFAEQRLEEYRKNNLAGTASVQDVLNAENDLIFARNAELDSTEAFANAVTKLWKDTGVLLERLSIKIDPSKQSKL